MDNQISMSTAIDRMAEIKARTEQLQAEYDKCSAIVLEAAESAMADTKIKSVGFASDRGNRAIVTVSDTVKNSAPSLFPGIFGGAYGDMVKEETTYKLTAPAKRLIASLWHREYCRGMTVQSIISSIRCSEEAKKALSKKLKGVNYDTDVKALQTIAELSYTDACDAAYMVAEAAAWQRIKSLIEAGGGECTDDKINRLQQLIDAAAIVERTSKIEVIASDKA